MRFLDFAEPQRDGTRRALFIVSHRSDKAGDLFISDPPFPADSSFFSQTSTGWVVWREAKGQGTSSPHIRPRSPVTVVVSLPQDGRTGVVAAPCWIEKARGPAPLKPFRWLVPGAFKTERHLIWTICPQEIQCPKRLPDGTVEPPRIISKAAGRP